MFGNCFLSQVYRKPTYTGLLLNYEAFCPYKWKVGLLQCMLHRAYSVCSNWTVFSNEMDKLKDIFKSNGYPDHVIHSSISRFLGRKFSGNSNLLAKDDNVETIFTIPYLGMPSVIYANKIKKVFRTFYNIEVKPVFTSFKVKNYFSLKSRTPFPLVSKVVYQFNCLRDANISYVGKTKLHLATRVDEHVNNPSAIKEHLRSCSQCKSNFSIQYFKIVDKANSDFECCIKEAIHLKCLTPSLNSQLSTGGASYFLKIF